MFSDSAGCVWSLVTLAARCVISWAGWSCHATEARNNTTHRPLARRQRVASLCVVCTHKGIWLKYRYRLDENISEAWLINTCPVLIVILWYFNMQYYCAKIIKFIPANQINIPNIWVRGWALLTITCETVCKTNRHCERSFYTSKLSCYSLLHCRNFL